MREMLPTTRRSPTRSAAIPSSARRPTKTVFWCVADVTEGRITFGRGNPCDSEAQTYAFA